MAKISAHSVPSTVSRGSGRPGGPGGRWAGTCGADQILAEAHELVEPAYRAVVGAWPAAARGVAGYHIGWWDADGRPAAGQGKAVRPALTLACARAADAQAGAAVEAAVAVKMVHDFSLSTTT
jgi:geranylgeranyl diphosphate synthase, type I